VIVGDDPVIESFVRIKKKFGEAIGVTMHEFRFAGDIAVEKLKKEVAHIAARAELDGVIIQLPLPSTIDVQAIVNIVPAQKDVDVLSHDAMVQFANGEAIVFPPVAGAVAEILKRHEVAVEGKEVLILGYGRLVGRPVSILLRHNNAHVTVIDQPVADLATHVREADIIVSGVGRPLLITPLMLREGTILIDAGTSESGGKIVGDADPACNDVAKLFTPVPGGVGPIAVAMLFKNLLRLTKARHEQSA
jgi:methylenetetrahydrofolate dehydrogenase (NADP+)/methenyltetrahydrofolate cyclohydrolase